MQVGLNLNDSCYQLFPRTTRCSLTISVTIVSRLSTKNNQFSLMVLTFECLNEQKWKCEIHHQSDGRHC